MRVDAEVAFADELALQLIERPAFRRELKGALNDVRFTHQEVLLAGLSMDNLRTEHRCPEPEPAADVYIHYDELPDTLLRGGILEATDEVPLDDLVDAARAASSKHPHLTAEIWRDGRKAAVVRPCWSQRH